MQKFIDTHNFCTLWIFYAMCGPFNITHNVSKEISIILRHHLFWGRLKGLSRRTKCVFKDSDPIWNVAIFKHFDNKFRFFSLVFFRWSKIFFEKKTKYFKRLENGRKIAKCSKNWGKNENHPKLKIEMER